MAVRSKTIKYTAFNDPEIVDGVVELLNDRKRAKDFLYEHQIEAVLKTKDYLTRNPTDPAIVALPTGCGKTGVAIVAAYALNVRRVLVITPSVAISDQIHLEFVGIEGKKKPFMVDHGILPGDDKKYIPSCGRIKNTTEIASNLQNDLLIVNAHKLAYKHKREDNPNLDPVVAGIQLDHYDLVIVDEAHHYPAETWYVPTDHFRSSKKIFLTATPFHQGVRVLTEAHISYEMMKEEAIKRGIIRRLTFDETPNDPTITAYEDISQRISKGLDDHDCMDKKVKHQAMVLVTTIEDALEFVRVYNEMEDANKSNLAITYYGKKTPAIVESFKKNKFRVLIVVGKLIEGFDHKPVSVVAIARNVQKESRVLFAQFVGRAVRKYHREENIDAVLISHPDYKQKENYDQFYEIASEDSIPEE